MECFYWYCILFFIGLTASAYDVSIVDSRKDPTMTIIVYVNNSGDIYKLYIKKDKLDKSDKIIMEWIKRCK